MSIGACFLFVFFIIISEFALHLEQTILLNQISLKCLLANFDVSKKY